MKKIIIITVLFITSLLAGTCLANSDNRVFDKVECRTDSFTNVTSHVYRTGHIKNFDISYAYIIKGEGALTFHQYPEEWDLLTQSRSILFKIDGVLYTKEYDLLTSIGNGYVSEFVSVLLDREFLALIAESKECKIRLGCCKETFINQQYKDGIADLIIEAAIHKLAKKHGFK